MRRLFFSTSVARPPTQTDDAMSAPVLVPAALYAMHAPARVARQGAGDSISAAHADSMTGK
jgi:hypothetical protein